MKGKVNLNLVRGRSKLSRPQYLTVLLDPGLIRDNQRGIVVLFSPNLNIVNNLLFYLFSSNSLFAYQNKLKAQLIQAKLFHLILNCLIFFLLIGSNLATFTTHSCLTSADS
jgi:hypothetical protein